MKYRDLKLTFSIGDTLFDVISISNEQIIKPYPRHAHSKNSYELHYVPAGQGTLVVDNKKYDIKAGTVFMTGPEVPHEQISVRNNPMTEYSIYVQILSNKTVSALPLVNAFLETPFWFGKSNSELKKQMEQLIKELSTRKTGYELMVQSLLQQIILTVARLYKKKTAQASEQPAYTRSVNEQAHLIIEEAFLYDYKTITLEELASRVSLGLRQTERLLQKHYGQTFIQKKTEARMSAATQLLLETDTTIQNIADDLGYSSPEHFTNAFKKYCKTSPSAYKKRNGNK